MKPCSLKHLLSIGIVVSALVPMTTCASDTIKLYENPEGKTPWMAHNATIDLVLSVKNHETAITTEKKALKNEKLKKRVKEWGPWSATTLSAGVTAKKPNRYTLGLTSLLAMFSTFNHLRWKTDRATKLENTKSEQSDKVNTAQQKFEAQVNGIPTLPLDKIKNFETISNTQIKDIKPTYCVLKNLSLRNMMKNKIEFQSGSDIINKRLDEGYAFLKTHKFDNNEERLNHTLAYQKDIDDAEKFIDDIMNQEEE